MNRLHYFAGGTLFLLATLGHSAAAGENVKPVRVVVWDEQQPALKQAFENFLGNAIADHLRKQPGITVRSMKLDDAEQGFSADVPGRQRLRFQVAARIRFAHL